MSVTRGRARLKPFLVELALSARRKEADKLRRSRQPIKARYAAQSVLRACGNFRAAYVTELPVCRLALTYPLHIGRHRRPTHAEERLAVPKRACCLLERQVVSTSGLRFGHSDIEVLNTK